MMNQGQTDKSFLLITNFRVWVRDMANALRMSPEDVMKTICQHLLDETQSASAQDSTPPMGAQSNLPENSQIAS